MMQVDQSTKRLEGKDAHGELRAERERMSAALSGVAIIFLAAFALSTRYDGLALASLVAMSAALPMSILAFMMSLREKLPARGDKTATLIALVSLFEFVGIATILLHANPWAGGAFAATSLLAFLAANFILQPVMKE